MAKGLFAAANLRVLQIETVLRRSEGFVRSGKPIRMPKFGFVRRGEGLLRCGELEGWFFQNMQNPNFSNLILLFLKLILFLLNENEIMALPFEKHLALHHFSVYSQKLDSLQFKHCDCPFHS